MKLIISSQQFGQVQMDNFPGCSVQRSQAVARQPGIRPCASSSVTQTCNVQDATSVVQQVVEQPAQFRSLRYEEESRRKGSVRNPQKVLGFVPAVVAKTVIADVT